MNLNNQMSIFDFLKTQPKKHFNPIAAYSMHGSKTEFWKKKTAVYKDGVLIVKYETLLEAARQIIRITQRHLNVLMVIKKSQEG